MKGFIQRVAEIAIGSIIVNIILIGWDHVTTPSYPEFILSVPVSSRKMPPTLEPTATRIPTTTTIPAPVVPTGVPIVYVFNLAPTRIWFDKADAVGYREAVLNGEPTRPFISLEKSRTIRGGRMLVLKQEDGLVMVRLEGEDVLGWMQ